MVDEQRKSLHETLQLACDLCVGLGAFAVSSAGRIEGLVADPMLPDDGPGRIELLAHSCLSHPAAAGRQLFWNAEVCADGESAEHLLACVVVPVWSAGVRLGLLGVVDTWLPEPDEREGAGLRLLADDVGAALTSLPGAESAGWQIRSAVGEARAVEARPVRVAEPSVEGRDLVPTLASPRPGAEITAADLIDALDDGVVCLDAAATVVLANRAADRMHGLTGHQTLVGSSLPEVNAFRTEDGHVVPFEDHPGLVALRQQRAWTANFTVGDGDEGWRRLEVSGRPFEIGGRPGAVVVLRDTTAEWSERHRLTQYALHDPLTGLANRHLLVEELGRMLQGLSRHGGSVALVYLDLDEFQHIKDRHGHDVGDEVLAVVARRLSGAVRSEDVVARLGGDEFVVATAVAERVPDGDLVVARIRKVLSAPFRVRGQAFGVQASVGWVSTDTPAVSPDALLSKADRAMHRQKRDGATPASSPP